jgi:glycosyltransferase involved in cell wall biosynthesis
MSAENMDQPKRIAFVSTRIHGTDGVSLEIEKWAHVLKGMGHECFYITGQSDRPESVSEVIPEALFTHPVIDEINRQCFGREIRSSVVSSQIHEMTWVLKERLREALVRFGIDVMIAENSVTIPMNIPLGLAIVETVMETGIGCIAHHHDFVWERERFLVNAVDDQLRTAFPPMLSQIQHVVINSLAAREFSRRTGLSCRVIPNVMDFDNPPPSPETADNGFRKALGISDDDFVILQPTRIIQRKGIEHTIELIRLLDDPRCKLVITHASSDEGNTYAERVKRYSELLGVEIIYAEDMVNSEHSVSSEGETRFSIWDAYREADLVSYPSTYEGFGNAFLEAIYFSKPVLCNRYAIYRTDIEPCGFMPILMDGFLTDEVVEQVRRVLTDDAYRREIEEHNYRIAHEYFSYSRVEYELRALLHKPRLALRLPTSA